MNVTDILADIPSKILLVLNAVNSSTNELKDYIKSLTNEIKQNGDKQDRILHTLENLPTAISTPINDTLTECTKKQIEASEKILQAIATNSDSITTAVSETVKEVQSSKSSDSKNEQQLNKTIRNIHQLWTNTLNTRKQAFWSYYRAKQTADTFELLLAEEPPKMPRKFLPREIPNEDPDQTEIRKKLEIEKFNSEKAKNNEPEKKCRISN